MHEDWWFGMHYLFVFFCFVFLDVGGCSSILFILFLKAYFCQSFQQDILFPISGTQGKSEITQNLLTFAVYIANLFFLTSDAIAPIVKDTDITTQQIGKKNYNFFEKNPCRSRIF